MSARVTTIAAVAAHHIISSIPARHRGHSFAVALSGLVAAAKKGFGRIIAAIPAPISPRTVAGPRRRIASR